MEGHETGGTSHASTVVDFIRNNRSDAKILNEANASKQTPLWSAVDDQGDTVLCLAAYTGLFDVCKLLLAHGADQKVGGAALLLACQHGFIKLQTFVSCCYRRWRVEHGNSVTWAVESATGHTK